MSLQMDNIDPDVKKLFDDAGISEQDLTDEATSQFIYDFIENMGGVAAVKQQVKRAPVRQPVAPAIPQPPIQNSGECIIIRVFSFSFF